MQNDYLRQIIDNYKAQCDLYKKILSLSTVQVDLLRENQVKSLHSFLLDRKSIMDEIVILNDANKALQENVLKDLKSDEFILSKLKKLVDPEIYEELQAVISLMSNLLQQINKSDKVNEALIKQSFKIKKSAAISNSKVKGAYQETMQNFTKQKPPDPK